MAKNTWSMSVVITSRDPKTKYNAEVAADKSFRHYASVDDVLSVVRAANAAGRGYNYVGGCTSIRFGLLLAFQVGLLHRVDRCTDHPDTKGYWITGEQA